MTIINKYIGKIITVTIDRPAGSSHPKYLEIIYPINYGYINGIIAPDGEEQDVYVLGINEPLTTFRGRVIAIIRRKNDVEEKWVVAPEGICFTDKEILKSVHFQERFFESYVYMNINNVERKNK